MELIARLEAATGPDRELDSRIWADVNSQPLYQYDSPEYGTVRAYEGGWIDPRLNPNVSMISPRYTASIDDALMLVPYNMDWEIKTAPDRRSVIARVVSMETTYRAESATPALALCIAALKARTPQEA